MLLHPRWHWWITMTQGSIPNYPDQVLASVMRVCNSMHIDVYCILLFKYYICTYSFTYTYNFNTYVSVYIYICVCNVIGVYIYIYIIRYMYIICAEHLRICHPRRNAVRSAGAKGPQLLTCNCRCRWRSASKDHWVWERTEHGLTVLQVGNGS